MTRVIASPGPSTAVCLEKPMNRRVLLALILAVFTLLAWGGPQAGAVSDSEELSTFGTYGTGAGETKFPHEVALDPITGHVYVSEIENQRISEFTAWGSFVKAFGWDVAPGAVNEQQEVRVRASAGDFRLSFEGSTTNDLPFNAPGSEADGSGSIEEALEALPSIGGAGGEVTVTEVPGTLNGVTPYIHVIAFGGSLAATNVGQLTASNGSIPLSGGSPTTVLEGRTRADGTTGGTGLEPCTAESGCQAGSPGGGLGQFERAAASPIVDKAGNVYVRNEGGERVQKFDHAGRFLFEFNVGNGRGVAIGSDDTLFFGAGEGIRRFTPAGDPDGEFPLPGGVSVDLAYDNQSSLLYISGPESVERRDPVTGAAAGKFEVAKSLRSIATDGAGNLYAAAYRPFPDPDEVRQFDPAGNPLSPPECCKSPVFLGVEEGRFMNIRGMTANAAGNLYVAYRHSPEPANVVRSFGPAPVMYEGPPSVAPDIEAQFASSVGRTDAVVAALINPHFWTDARYYVEYGTGECSAGGCNQLKPLPPGALLSAKATSSQVKTSGIVLDGLQPNTTYHYRFVASSGGGGPVGGIGGEVGIDGTEATLTTLPVPLEGGAGCPNETFRTGFSTHLPDCRAFEMVSPVDKLGGDVKTLLNAHSYSNAVSQSSVAGGAFTYSSYRAFGDPTGAAMTNQYLASRIEGDGWDSEAILPRQGLNGAEEYGLNANFDNQYKAFSADLCRGWLAVATEPPLAAGATDGPPALYRRENCANAGTYETLAQSEGLKGGLAGNAETELQGMSADGSAVVVRATSDLTHGGGGTGPSKAYYSSNGSVQPICILPSGAPFAGRCSAGTTPELSGSASDGDLGRVANVTHAMSSDGSKVYWTAVGDNLPDGDRFKGTGRIFLRQNPGREQSASGACDEPEKACTLKVSETKSALSARFWAASVDGGKALYEFIEGALAGNLYRFDAEDGSSTLIARKSLGLVGAGDDLSDIYFVSEERLAGTTGATAGKPNLYHAGGEGNYTFIATLSRTDVQVGGANDLIPSNVERVPVRHVARASADGRTLAFISTESLTGYDNTDAVSSLACGAKEGSKEGICDSEVFRYEVGSEGPVCISCNPSGAQPQGRSVAGGVESNLSLATAASLPAPTTQLYVPRALSAGGDRLFFDSYDALVSRDTNGKKDVYQWEAADGAAQCEALGAELFVKSSGGCLSLISSGESPSDSEFLDASASGDDVFFVTNASLLPQDPGLYDVYDARVGGGLPQPMTPAACEGEACQGPFTPPVDPTPASSSFNGPGNVKDASAKKKKKSAKKKSRKKKSHKKGKSKKGKSKKGKSKKGKSKQARAHDSRGTGR
jgi:hypothetical protein